MPGISGSKLLMLLAPLLILLSRPARCEIVVEQSLPHESLGSAQHLSSSDFTLEHNPEVFLDAPTVSINGALESSSEIDFYSFYLPASETILADIDDTRPGNLDTVLSLFDSSGTLIGFDDDSDPPDPGSVSGSNSFLGSLPLTGPATFYIAVTGYGNRPDALDQRLITFIDVFRPDGGEGGSAMINALPDATFTMDPGALGAYTLHITVVPEPGSLLLCLSGCGGLLLAVLARGFKEIRV